MDFRFERFAPVAIRTDRCGSPGQRPIQCRVLFEFELATRAFSPMEKNIGKVIVFEVRESATTRRGDVETMDTIGRHFTVSTIAQV